METTSYRSPFDKVFRRTWDTLKKKGYKLTEDEKKEGIIYAYRKRTFLKASANLEIIISRIDESSTSITVYSDAGKHWFDKANKRNRHIESMFIALITTRI